MKFRKGAVQQLAMTLCISLCGVRGTQSLSLDLQDHRGIPAVYLSFILPHVPASFHSSSPVYPKAAFLSKYLSTFILA